MMAREGLTDVTDGFVAARIPGCDDGLWTGYGQLADLTGASDLHRRPIHGDIRQERFDGVDIDARYFARTVFDARPDAMACIHGHGYYSMVFAALDVELLPISQYAFMYHDLVGYVPWPTAELSGKEHERTVTGDEELAKIGDQLRAGKEIVVLRNHGTVIQGRSVAHAFWTLSRFELTCRIQLDAMATSGDLSELGRDHLAAVKASFWQEDTIDSDGSREWPAYERLIDREDTSWRR